MDNLYLHSGYSRPLRPNIYDRESRPSIRVSSDPDSSSRRPHLHKHKSSHRHHHHHDEHHRHSSTRHHAKEVVQLALQPPTSFGDLLKQARGSKDPSPSHSRSHSRRGSPRRGETGGQQTASKDVGLTIPPPRPLRPEDIERESRRVEARERYLRTALQTLSDQSLRTSRRLDDTYYSILEKVSTLRQTIGTMQELSGLTKELHINFEADSKHLLDDVRSQFENSDNFDAQQKQVAVLEERVRAGKEKADALTARLAEAKKRVDERARSEAEWEASTNRWWQWFGGIVASIVSLIVILVVLHHLKPTHVDMNPKPMLDPAVAAKIREAPIPRMAKDNILELATSVSTVSLQRPSAQSSAGLDDRLLRRFDEL
ncbi:uncharacterized protein M421DRAFT_416977 [Didymella exigua CBS 183.55]|uniref:Uncharacterized protein n=1 Tax=Didymella exigua CBS 183.55 TaxID=1150837 RepID=A0A6A5S191_9PLEO|nr:uncharacterized protein M421DRAFT_416977 [Didymella exigua CBS 183.55]KAF1932256.1 hypothetical protein M421DRAFT_416977 [Didymella exigua CBS 183.55]